MSVKVSVIVPVYNVEMYLPKCIDSILAQTFTDYELILVDDGSPDRCGEICDDYAQRDSRIKVIHKSNGGLGDARNVGIRVAKGDYLLFVDSDDTIASDLLESTVSAAKDNHAEIVIFNMSSVNEHGQQLALFHQNIPEMQVLTAKDCPPVLIAPPCAWNKLYSRLLFTDNDIFYPVGVWYEDLRTTAKLLTLAKSIYYIGSEPRYFYLQRAGSIMNSKSFDRLFRDRTAALDDLIQYFSEHGLYEQYFQELEAIAAFQCFFFPCREILISGKKSPYLDMLYKNIFEKFPRFSKTLYAKNLTKQEKLLFFLLTHRCYTAVGLLSMVKKRLSSTKQMDGES